MKYILPLLFICTCSVNALAQFEVFDYPGADHTYVTGMNDLGDFVGYFTVGGTTTGFYVIGSDTNDLVFPGSANTWAHGISLDRKIVGKYNDTGSLIDNEGFMYDYALQDYEDLTFLQVGSSNYTQVTGINDNGCWAGSFRNPTSAFMMLDCDNGFESDRYQLMATYGTCVNDYDYVGGYIIDGADYTAFIRDFAGNFELVNHPSSIKTRIFGMNDVNMCVGDFGNQFGFLYDPSAPSSLSQFEDIIIPDAISVTPQDINNNDQMCGYFSDENGNYHGFIIRGYDIGFRPQPDAWFFPNEEDALWPSSEWADLSYTTDPYLSANLGLSQPFPENDEGAFPVFSPSTFPSWPLMVETFGEGEFYKVVNGVVVLRDQPFEVWKKWAKDDWSGSCYGMGMTALMYYQDAAAFHNKFSDMPSSIPTIFSLGPDEAVRKINNQMQVYQYGKIFKDQFFDQSYNPTPIQTLAAIKAMMVDETPDYFSVNIRNTNATGPASFHALVPFKVEPGTDHSWWNVFVYDSNHPDDTTRHIRVHKNATTAVGGAWYYEAAANVGLGEEEWGGPHANFGFRISLPVSDHLPVPELRIGPHSQSGFRSANHVSAYFTKSAEEYFVSGSDSLGYYNGHVIEGYPNAVAYSPATSGYDKPTGYLLQPGQNHSATVTNAQEGIASMTVVTDDEQLFGYIRSDATPAQKDEVEYDMGLTYTNPDVQDKTVSFRAYLNEQGVDYNYEIKDVNCEQNAEIHIEPINDNELIVTNTGAATHYNLTISILSSTDASTFEVDNVPFAEDGTHHIVPFWDDLADDGIYITVDTLSVGVDDTLFLDNQALPELGLSNGLLQYNNAATNGTLSVINSGGGHLDWDVASVPSWVTVVSGSSGTDDGEIQFDVDANSGADRTGYIIINSNDANSPDSVLVWQGMSMINVEEAVTDEQPIIVYPNPVKDILRIGLSVNVQSADIRLRDIQGRLLSMRTTQNGGIHELDMSSLNSGLYLVEVFFNSEREIYKVMKD